MYWAFFSQEILPPERVVVFDLDHTLAAGDDHFPRAWYEVLAGHASPAAIREGYNQCVGKSVATVIRACIPDASEQLVQRLEQELDQWLEENARYQLMPQAQWLLEGLAARGDWLAISTGNPQHVAERALAALDIAHYFELVLGSAEGFEKREHLEEVIQRLGLSARQLRETTAAVGDGRTEMIAAADAGVGLRIGLTTGEFSAEQLREAGATQIANGLRDVAELLGLVVEER